MDKVKKAMWRYHLSRMKVHLVAFVVVFLVSMITLLLNISVGPGQEVIAYVDTVGVGHGPTGTSTYLFCELQDGNRVNVPFHESVLIKTGDKVKLLTIHKLIGGMKYEFVSLVAEE